MKKIINYLLFMFFCSALMAEVVPQAFKIEAENFYFDYKTGLTCYEGNVIFVQENSEAAADKVEVFLTENKKIKKLVATGAPVVYKQKLEDGSYLEARADKMTYLANGIIKLTGKANMQKQGSLYEANEIEINTKTSELRSTGGRTKMTISAEALEAL